MTNIDISPNNSAKVSLISPEGDTHFIYELREKYLNETKRKMFLYSGALFVLNLLLFFTHDVEYNQETAVGIVAFHLLSVAIWFSVVGIILYRMYLLDKCLFSILNDDVDEKINVIRSVTSHLQTRTYYYASLMFALTLTMYFTLGWQLSDLLCISALAVLATFMLHFTEFRKNTPYSHEIESLEAQGARWAYEAKSDTQKDIDTDQSL
jgi:heme O synthase-like polyprenyltransferase